MVKFATQTLSSMQYVALAEPAGTVRHLPFYLAMEEYVLAECMDEASDDCFFIWQVHPTVIMGRHQIGSREIDFQYCRSHGIEVYRRRSGGGCVFADMNNLMFSYLTRRPDKVSGTYSRYTSMVVSMLRSLGLDASDNSRNDILIGGRKVSGNAYYLTDRGSIVHGTMLFDTDTSLMAGALTPSRSKLASKGVDSVSARITTLNRHLSIDIDEFKNYARRHMCGSEIVLGDADISAIERLSEPYYSPEWLTGFDSRADRRESQRIDGAGEFIPIVTLNPVTGLISRVSLAGDFFNTADVDALLQRLHGVAPTRQAIADAICGIDISAVIPGLDNENFIDLII